MVISDTFVAFVSYIMVLNVRGKMIVTQSVKSNWSPGKNSRESRREKPIFHCDAKPFALGPRVGLDPQCHNLVLPPKNANICVTPEANAKISVTPSASQWNIGCVGSPTRGAGIGHGDFMFFVSISFGVGWPT